MLNAAQGNAKVKKKPKNECKKLQYNIRLYGKQIKLPTNLEFTKNETLDCVDIKIAKTNNFDSLSKNHKIEYDNHKIEYDNLNMDIYKTNIIKLCLTTIQEHIFNIWINGYTEMYNEAIKYLNNRARNGGKYENIEVVRKNLYNIKKQIMERHKYYIGNKMVKIASHTLDCAINDANNRLRSCLTNLKKGNIRYFRLRPIKMEKKNRIFKIEKCAFVKNGFYKRVFGNIKCENNKEDFDYTKEIDTTCVIKKIGNDYYLYARKLYELNQGVQTNKIISIDPGVRTYMTCYSNDSVIEIGNDINEKFKKRLLLIDRLKSKLDQNQIKPRNRICVRKRYEKLNNISRDIRWKVARMLVDEYSAILIGNLSTKDIGENNNVGKMTKRIANLFSFYKTKEVLRYLCVKHRVQFKEVRENYTTKCCGKCGNKNNNLGGAKEYNCEKCNLKIGRDHNSARLMLIKSFE